MAEKNVQINYYNGSSYDILYPQVKIDSSGLSGESGYFLGNGSDEVTLTLKNYNFRILCLSNESSGYGMDYYNYLFIRNPTFSFSQGDATSSHTLFTEIQNSATLYNYSGIMGYSDSKVYFYSFYGTYYKPSTSNFVEEAMTFATGEKYYYMTIIV